MSQFFKTLLAAGCALALGVAALFAEKTNVIVFLVDDMGYSDPGYMGGEAETPHLNQLSKEGVTFTNCYNNAKCAPSRAALMTGMSCQRVKAFKSKGNIAANNAASIAEILAEQGYATIHAGKWHIAPDPLQSGFQNHFGVNLAPFYFKRDVIGLPGREKLPHPLMLEGERVDGHTLPDDWYGTRAYTDYAIEKIKEKALDQDKPFFLYLAINAPHGPLEAPKEVVDKYVNRYDEGTDVARKQRYDRLVELGVINPETLKLPEMPKNKDGEAQTWDTFNEKEQRLFKRKLAIAAAMVDIIDQETGKLIQFLKDTEQYENTLLIFLSDNGATAEQGVYGGLPFDTMTNEDIDVLGTRSGMKGGTSGGVVAAVQNVPYRGYKTSLWDGGMHTSMIINWPGHMSAAASRDFVRTPVSIYDLAPTIYAATGVEYPKEINGRELKNMDGVNILPLLVGQELDDRYIRYAYKGDQVIRNDKFKLLGKRGKKSTIWALYDLQVDASETTDVIDQYPEQAKELIAEWERFDEYANIANGYDGFFANKGQKAKESGDSDEGKQTKKKGKKQTDRSEQTTQ